MLETKEKNVVKRFKVQTQLLKDLNLSPKSLN